MCEETRTTVHSCPGWKGALYVDSMGIVQPQMKELHRKYQSEATRGVEDGNVAYSSRGIGSSDDISV